MSTSSVMTVALTFKAIDLLTAPLKKMNEQVAGVGTAASGAAGKTGGLTTGLNNNTRAATGLGAAIGRTAQKFAQSYDAMIAKTKQLSERMKESGDRAQLGAAATGAGVVKSLSAFKDLEAAQTSLKVAMMTKGGVVNRADYADMSALADKLGKDYMGSTEDFYKMFRILQEQGIQVKDILGGTGKAVADFSAVTGEGYNDAALKIAKFQDTFGILSKDMPEFTNQASKAKFAFGIDTTEIFYAMPYLGGALKQLNIQGIGASESVLRLMGMLSQAGMPASQIGESLNQLINRMADFDTTLSRNSKKMKKVREELAGTGIEFNFWDKNDKFVGFEKMIAEFEKMKGLSEKKRIEVGKALFGDVAGKSVSVLAVKGVAGWKEAEEVVRRQADQTERVAAVQKGLAFKWDSFTGTVRTFTAAIGESISNSTGLKVILDKLNDGFGFATTWIKEHKTLATVIGVTMATTAALTAGVVALGTAVMVGGSVLSAYGAGLGVIRFAAGPAAREIKLLVLAMRGMSAAQVTHGMFGEIITTAPVAQSRILAAVAATKAWTVAQWGALRANWLSVAALKAKGAALLTMSKTGIMTAIGMTRLWIVTQYQSLTAAYAARGGLLGLSKAFALSFVSGIKTAMLAMRAFTAFMFTNPIGLIALAIGIAALLIIKYWKPISGFFKGMWTGLKEGLKGLEPAWNEFKKYALVIRPFFEPLFALGRLIKALIGPVNDTGKAAENMGLRFGKAIAGILVSVLTLPGKMFAAGMNFITSLTDGMLAKIKKPVEIINNLTKRMRGFFPFSPAKEGALRDIHKVRLVETIAEGIKPQPMVRAMKAATAATMIAAAPAMGMAQPADTTSRPAVASLARPISAGQGNAPITIHFAPQITVQGGGDPASVKGAVMDAAKLSQAELERMIERIMAQKQRRSF
ncbi:MAG: phage tail tape measure protein [Geobacter sp.]|nr:phage tail tape measure protein [Geobacter sp.]